MKKKNLKKLLLAVCCAALLVCVSIGATVAYLTSTKTVKNTFTVGNVQIKLDEEDITKSDGSRTEEGNVYKIFPGRSYKKDPTVTVKAGSEESYVRMKVEVENIDQLKAVFTDASYYAEDGTFLLQNLVKGWEPTNWISYGYTQSADGKTGTYEFRYKDTVKNDKTNDQKLEPLFTTIVIPGDVDNDGLKKLGNVEINITAEAIQKEGFDTATAAWTAFGA